MLWNEDKTTYIYASYYLLMYTTSKLVLSVPLFLGKKGIHEVLEAHPYVISSWIMGYKYL